VSLRAPPDGPARLPYRDTERSFDILKQLPEEPFVSSSSARLPRMIALYEPSASGDSTNKSSSLSYGNKCFPFLLQVLFGNSLRKVRNQQVPFLCTATSRYTVRSILDRWCISARIQGAFSKGRADLRSPNDAEVGITARALVSVSTRTQPA
jgi:hypothetical protein